VIYLNSVVKVCAEMTVQFWDRRDALMNTPEVERKAADTDTITLVNYDRSE
jgi:hypothetical protein